MSVSLNFNCKQVREKKYTACTRKKKKINYPNKIYTQDKFFLICLKKKGGMKNPRILRLYNKKYYFNLKILIFFLLPYNDQIKISSFILGKSLYLSEFSNTLYNNM